MPKLLSKKFKEYNIIKKKDNSINVIFYKISYIYNILQKLLKNYFNNIKHSRDFNNLKTARRIFIHF